MQKANMLVFSRHNKQILRILKTATATRTQLGINQEKIF